MAVLLLLLVMGICMEGGGAVGGQGRLPLSR